MPRRGSRVRAEEETGRMGVRVRRMEVRGAVDVTITIRLLIKIMAFLCVSSDTVV